MAIENIGAVAASQSNVQAAGLGQEDFIKVLVTQLTYQDPLKPMDNQAFISQMAQFTALEQTRQLNTKVDTLLTIQSASQAINILGKTAEVETASGNVVGTVTTLTFSSEGQPFITLRTASGEFLTDIGLSKVSLIR